MPKENASLTLEEIIASLKASSDEAKAAAGKKKKMLKVKHELIEILFSKPVRPMPRIPFTPEQMAKLKAEPGGVPPYDLIVSSFDVLMKSWVQDDAMREQYRAKGFAEIEVYEDDPFF